MDEFSALAQTKMQSSTTQYFNSEKSNQLLLVQKPTEALINKIKKNKEQEKNYGWFRN